MRGVAVAGGFHLLPVPQSSPSSLSLRLAAPRFRRRPLHNDGYPRQSLFRSSITRLSSSLSTLRSFPSRSRGRTATQDSLPAGGQPLPDAGRYPARSQMKFQSRRMRHPPHPSFRNASRVAESERNAAPLIWLETLRELQAHRGLHELARRVAQQLYEDPMTLRIAAES